MIYSLNLFTLLIFGKALNPTNPDQQKSNSSTLIFTLIPIKSWLFFLSWVCRKQPTIKSWFVEHKILWMTDCQIILMGFEKRIRHTAPMISNSKTFLKLWKSAPMISNAKTFLKLWKFYLMSFSFFQLV